MTAADLPPMVQLQVQEEDQPAHGRDYFAPGKNERLFDTPCAIARVVRSTRYLRRMVVSAETSSDLSGKPLSYHWSVLRGDADRIKINRLNEAGSVVELLIPYHTRRAVEAGSSLESNRVDIGAFVHNGAYYSAPAFVTHFYLDNEKRVYDQDHRIQLVDYADPDVGKNYVDPAIDAPKRWRDEYHYEASGASSGWTRVRGEVKQQFTAEGVLITATDDTGRPTEGRRVQYVLKRQAQGKMVVEQQETEETVPLGDGEAEECHSPSSPLGSPQRNAD
jgi:hypothetical protein